MDASGLAHRPKSSKKKRDKRSRTVTPFGDIWEKVQHDDEATPRGKKRLCRATDHAA